MRELGAFKFRAWYQEPKYEPNGRMYRVAGFHNVIEHDYDEPERDISATIQQVCLVDELPAVEKVWWFDAKDVTLMQFTGVFDRLKVGIYEGDIVELEAVDGEQIETGVIEYSGAEFVIRIKERRVSLNDTAPLYVKIIGNIFEHPAVRAWVTLQPESEG